MTRRGEFVEGQRAGVFISCMRLEHHSKVNGSIRGVGITELLSGAFRLEANSAQCYTTAIREQMKSNIESTAQAQDRRGPAESHVVPSWWNSTEMPFERERSVADFLRDHARTNPEGVAIKAGDKTMSFATLDRMSNRVANCLLRAGLVPEEIVALLLEQSFEYVVAALGVIKAGGAYLPIDVRAPDHRLLYKLTDSHARFAFAGPSQLARFCAWNGTLIALDDTFESLSAESQEAVMVPSDPARRAYVIYTSGSTGMPKGVEVEHHSLTNMVRAYQSALGLTARDRGTLIANVAFDASVGDLWPCLCAGGALLIPPHGLTSDLDGLIAWLAAEGATYTYIPTALVELMLSRPWPEQMALRYLDTGGDTLHVRPPRGLPFQLINGYGPTENTVVSTWAVVSPDDDGERPSIGRPIGNVKVYVLDEEGHPVPPGVEGELYLGGEQVARGYLGRPTSTREKFLPDPFSDQPGAWMYRTGDWVRWRPDGSLDFIGRKDNQIQIRGRRVELGEIEQALHAHPAVRQACCQPKILGNDTIGVIAHVATSNPSDKLADDLRHCLTQRLPAYMVPADFVFYENLPVTSRGKVDRSALKIVRSQPPSPEGIRLPSNSQEEAVARLWHELLPAACRAGSDATFASLGGDSLQTVKLLLGVEEITGRRIAISTFLLEPTLPGLCRALKADPVDGQPQLVVLRREGTLPPLICLYGIDGDAGHYFEFAKLLGEDQPVYAVRSPGLTNPDKLPRSMEEAARQVIDCVRHISPHGAPVFLGYSWAGLLAFEVGRQWHRTTGVAPFVGLVGTEAPLRRFSAAARIKHFVVTSPNWCRRWVSDYLSGRRRFPSLDHLARRFKDYIISNPGEDKRPIPKWADTPIMRHHIGLEIRYNPVDVVPLELDLFREREDYEWRGVPSRPEMHPFVRSNTNCEPDGGWGRWAGRTPRVRWINTNHEEIMGRAAAELAVSVRNELQTHRQEQEAALAQTESVERFQGHKARLMRQSPQRLFAFMNWRVALPTCATAVVALFVLWLLLPSDNAVAMIQNDARVVVFGDDSQTVTNPGPGFVLKEGDRVQAQDETGLELQFDDVPVQLNLRFGTVVTVTEVSQTPTLFVEKGTVDVDTEDEEMDFVLQTPHAEAKAASSRFTLSVTSGSTTLESNGGEVEITSLDSGKTVELQDGYSVVIEPGNDPVVTLIPQGM